MAVPERRLDEVAPEESRAAEYQYIHLCLLKAKTPSSPYAEVLLACCDDGLSRTVDDPVDDAVLQGFFRS